MGRFAVLLSLVFLALSGIASAAEGDAPTPPAPVPAPAARAWAWGAAHSGLQPMLQLEAAAKWGWKASPDGKLWANAQWDEAHQQLEIRVWVAGAEEPRAEIFSNEKELLDWAAHQGWDEAASNIAWKSWADSAIWNDASRASWAKSWN